MGSPSDLVGWALTQIGTTEDPPNSNHVHYWDDIGMSGAQGQPWCAAFVLAGLQATGTPATTESVYVPTIHDDYSEVEALHHVRDGKPGDQVLYLGSSFPEGHTGILVSVDSVHQTVIAIEGNTSSGGSGSQWNGGGVFQRQRPWSDVWGVGRPNFIENPEDEMQRFFVDGKGKDDVGADSCWEVVYPTGDIKNWNGARFIPSLRSVVPNHVPIAGAYLDPSGDALVLVGDDGHQEQNGHWLVSTYKLEVQK